MKRLCWLLFVVVATGVIGCDKLKKGDPDTTIPAKGLDPNREPDFKLSAEDYYTEFKKDMPATKAKYTDKLVEVTGVIETFGRNLGGEVQVFLEVKGQPLGLICFTKDKNPWNSAEPGQTVTIRGLFPIHPFASAPTLIECQIISATGTKTTLTLDADDLGKQYDANPKAVEEKYKFKKVFIKGTVETRKVVEKDVVIVYKTSSKVKVVAVFTPVDKDDANKVPIGQTARIYGEYNPIFADDGEIALGRCLYTPEK